MPCESRSRTGPETALDAIAAHPHQRVVVLVTEDPGIASFARSVIGRFGRQSCRVHPGISAVQLPLARLGLSWERVRIVNAHAGPPHISPAVHDGPEVIPTSGNSQSRSWTVGYISRRAHTDEVATCEDLSVDSERVHGVATEQLPGTTVSSRTVVVIPDKESSA
jgi:cobalt-precorrin-7 (C5)-methyltransferase